MASLMVLSALALGEPRTTVDVWRLRELQLPVLPAPASGAGPVCGSDETVACDPMEENEWLRLIVAVRAAIRG